MSITYELARNFKKKYPKTVAWRLKSHSKIIDMHLSDNEEILYLFLGQKNQHPLDFVNTYIIAITNKRIMLATKRLVFGYFLISITPDMYNDITIKKGLIWGNIIIDTVKEKVYLSDIDPKALPEIENRITDIMRETKKVCNNQEHKCE
ncbi:MAG: PH domain-containing protein [Firmicutes bacterium]|nr:PH domain-containing protein [Bacillota bacterium]